MPKVSVIIPVYNVESYLQACLDSIINQTYNNLEIICVDDGSKDESGKILDDYASKDKRFVVKHQHNEGVSAVRNKALKLATGEYVMFVDADDWLDLDAVESSLKYCIDNNLDICFFSYVSEHGKVSMNRPLFSDNKLFLGENNRQMARRIIGPVGEELCQPLKLDSFGTIWAKLYKHSVIKDLHFEDLNVIGSAEDSLFNMYAFHKAKNTGYLHMFYYHYRANSNGSITGVYRPWLRDRWKVQYGMIRSSFNDEQSIKALQNRIAISLYGLTRSLLRGPKAYRDIKQTLKDPVFSTAKAQLQTQYMGVMWKVFFRLVKNDYVVLIILFHKSVMLAQRILR